MPHDLEEPGKVVLRLPGGVRPAQVEGGEVLPELDEDFLPAGRGEIKARVRSHLGLRSEEHTSELQSLRHLVCRLLLEKKNLQTASGAAVDAHHRSAVVSCLLSSRSVAC